ncbi:MAG TPA: hypothetical protein VF077_03975 [Nitrospiraceae bacterium]
MNLMVLVVESQNVAFVRMPDKRDIPACAGALVQVSVGWINEPSMPDLEECRDFILHKLPEEYPSAAQDGVTVGITSTLSDDNPTNCLCVLCKAEAGIKAAIRRAGSVPAAMNRIEPNHIVFVKHGKQKQMQQKPRKVKASAGASAGITGKASSRQTADGETIN